MTYTLVVGVIFGLMLAFTATACVTFAVIAFLAGFAIAGFAIAGFAIAAFNLALVADFDSAFVADFLAGFSARMALVAPTIFLRSRCLTLDFM